MVAKDEVLVPKEKALALIDTMVDDIVPVVKPFVEAIEAGTKTTRGNYGRYMSVFSQVAGDNRQVAFIVKLALLKAGANKDGVESAYNICFGQS